MKLTQIQIDELLSGQSSDSFSSGITKHSYENELQGNREVILPFTLSENSLVFVNKKPVTYGYTGFGTEILTFNKDLNIFDEIIIIK